MEIKKVIEVLKEARKCIARLTPFPANDISENDENEILLKAINETADYADKVREKINNLLAEIESDKINET